MKKMVILLLSILLYSGCGDYLSNKSKQDIKEITLDSYEIGYIAGKKNLDYLKYRNKIENIINKYLCLKN
jgi:hypothetical protein